MVFMKLKKIAICYGGIAVILIAITCVLFPNIVIYFRGI